MQQLDSHFKAIFPTLLEEMEKAGTNAELLQAVRERFSTLLGPNGSFGSKLTAREQRLVSYFFNPFLIALLLFSKTEITVQPRMVEHVPQNRDRGDSVAVATSAASTLAAAITPAVIPAMVFGLAAGGTALLLARKVFSQPNENSVQRDDVTVDIHINPGEIQDALDIAVSNYDKFAAEIEDIRKDALSENLQRLCKIEEVPNVIPFFHEMLGFEQELSELDDSVPEYIVGLRACLKSFGSKKNI